jgi:hypothetical protein
MLASTAVACNDPPGGDAVVIVIQDGSVVDARDVVTPGVLGVELGLAGSPLSIRVVELRDLDVDALISDQRVVAAVVAPFTRLPEASVSALRGGGIATLSMSEVTSAGEGDVPYRAFTTPVREQAELGSTLTGCAAGDDTTWSKEVLAEVRSVRILRGSLASVAHEVVEAGCRGLLWTGAADGGVVLAELLARTSPTPGLVVTSLARTPRFATTVDIALTPVGLCPCADATTSVEPVVQRFVHGYQRAHGLDPGPFAVEGFDIGRSLAAASEHGSGRDAMAGSLASMQVFEGTMATYVWSTDGDLLVPSLRTYQRAGLRWREVSSGRVARVVPWA